MAFSAHKTEEEVKEHFEDEAAIKNKAQQFAELLRNSKHCIVFTGAGISTACGIPDFRGPTGVWTLRAKGQQPGRGNTLKAIPSYTHMALCTLVKMGIVKKVVSQNTDGLHRKSGLNASEVCELHGNSNKEICTSCDREYLRDARVRTASAVHDHLTGRTCESADCNGKLKDTIINFGENLKAEVIDEGFKQGGSADLCLSLGSSLTVTPAADIPKTVAKRGKLVVVNLQNTPLDRYSAIRVYAKCDDFMRAVMQELNVEVPAWTLLRHLQVAAAPTATGKTCVTIGDVDETGNPYRYLAKLLIQNSKQTMAEVARGKTWFSVVVPATTEAIDAQLHFNGFYGEEPFTMRLPAKQGAPSRFILMFNPYERKWAYVESDELSMSHAAAATSSAPNTQSA